MYSYRQSQFLPIGLEEAWAFFSSPRNLSRITPPKLRFEILDDSGSEEMFPGQIIRYKVSPLPGFRVTWVTEITHVDRPGYFSDEQRFGPYAFWHHKHFFQPADGGTQMTDLVHYKLPLGMLGRLVHGPLVRSRLEEIFRFRRQAVEDMFPVPSKTG